MSAVHNLDTAVRLTKWGHDNGVIEAPSEADDLPRIVPASEMATRAPVLPDELIEGMLHRGAKMLLGGGSKSFKTWCLMDLGLSIATGRPWWGRKTLQGKVLYLNLEVQDAFFWFRLQHIGKAKGVTLPDDLRVWNLRGYCADHATFLPKLAKRIEGEEYAAVIVDPTYKITNGSENDTEVIGALMNSIEKMAVSVNAAVIFGAHFAKGNASQKEAIDRVSGSGVFARDPDAIVMMTRHEQEGAFTIDPILRNCPQITPFCVRWDFPLMRPAPELDPLQLKKPPGGFGSTKSKTPPPVEKVLEVVEEVVGEGTIPGAVNSDKGLVKKLEEVCKVTRTAAQVSIEAAVGNGLSRILERRKDGKGKDQVFYQLTRNRRFEPRATNGSDA